MSAELLKMRGYEAASDAMGLYAGGDSSKAMVALIQATEELYIEELIEARPDRVIELQCFIRQLRALRTVASGKGGTPKI